MGNSYYGRYRAGTAISRRHMVSATHFKLGNGTEVYFYDTAGNIHTNVIVGGLAVMHGAVNTDIYVHLLQDELPCTITPARILPRNYSSYIRTGLRLPCIFIDQDEHVNVLELASLPTDISSLSAQQVSGFQPTGGLRAAFYEHVVNLDSGSPRFLVLGNEVVLLNVMWSGANSAGSGSSIELYRDDVQNAMDALCPGYLLQEVDRTSCVPLVRF